MFTIFYVYSYITYIYTYIRFIRIGMFIFILYVYLYTPCLDIPIYIPLC